MRPLAIGLFILWLLFEIGCEDSVVVTDVSGNYANTVEYPCLSSSNDCLSSMSVNGGTFPFFSSFHLDSISGVKGAVITIHGHSRNADDYFDKMISVINGENLKDEVLVVSPKFNTLYEQSLETDWYWNTTSWNSICSSIASDS